ncbi:hypothetical protein BH11MYX1_BH11MYX1_56820 [soil metagenome]
MTGAPITPEMLREIGAHARACFPAECCGYITDRVVRCTNAQDEGLHPTTPARSAETGFVIAGREWIAFARSFDTSAPPRTVYHSHTNGLAYVSEVDREVARLARYPVDHLVIGVVATRLTEAALFRAGDFVELARWPGEMLG